MESVSINKWRIKKRWHINSDGYKEDWYYPQYHSKLFGWRNVFQTWSTQPTSQSVIPSMDTLVMFVGMAMAIATIVGLFFVLVGEWGYLPLFLCPSMLVWLVIFLTNRISEEDIQRFRTKGGAKQYITKRINSIIEATNIKKRTHESQETLPDNEVFYLDIKSERFAKLKKLKNKSRFRIK